MFAGMKVTVRKVGSQWAVVLPDDHTSWCKCVKEHRVPDWRTATLLADALAHRAGACKDPDLWERLAGAQRRVSIGWEIPNDDAVGPWALLVDA